ncbi:uncharacterized protein BXZ73DRAFT_105881 [Epithele typhae]|uniref:uncharacterized protein n=1 Tax=Epithele typhae TaxID=378194 RepID=UPI002008DFE9|nr:uncharacterized protein BXZ73DRAFT_105881 [Epithele typhae]KAH9916251.1 hypothetical protein BXZ73DRAFT_105881 [Epithele typhae]
MSVTHLSDTELSFVSDSFVRLVFGTIAFVILYYDYFLTLGDEFQRYWGRPSSPVSFGFFFNRYLSVLGNIPVLIQFYGNPLSPLVTAALQLQRVHALYGGSKRVLGLLLAVGSILASVVIWAWVALMQAGSSPSYNHLVHEFAPVLVGCNTSVSETQGICALYFGVILLLHMSNIWTSVFTQCPLLLSFGLPRLPRAPSSIATTLMSRLMLNLRDPRIRGDALTMPSSSIVLTSEIVIDQ